MNAISRPVQPTVFDAASQEIIGLRAEFEKMLGGAIGVERFERAMLTAIQRDPDLLDYPKDSLISAGLKAAQDRLLPDGREGAFLIRWNSKNKRKEVTWAPMVYGIVKVAKQYAGVRTMSCEIVYENEPFRILMGDEMRIDHERMPAFVRNGAEVGCYAIVTYADGAREREFMTAMQLGEVEGASESAKKGMGPWVTWRTEMMRKSVIRRLSKKLPAMDEGGEALRRVIERVDEDYSFNQPTRAVPNLAADTAVDPRSLISATSLRIDALDTALAGINTAAEVRAYLDQPATRAWLDRLCRTSPQQAAQADTLLAATWARVDPSSREGEPSVTTTQATDWRAASWPIFSRGGTFVDMQDADAWEAAFASRIQHVEQHARLDADGKRHLLGVVLDCNRAVLDHLRERGHGAAVEAIEGLFAESLFMSAEVPA